MSVDATSHRTVYLDTSAWVKLYIVEAGSEEVQDAVQQSEGLRMNALQETEFRNGIWAGMGRGYLNRRQANTAIRLLEGDFESGLLMRETLDWVSIWQEAMRLSRHHTPQLLTRTLDIVHVAIAKNLHYTSFVTGDRRQSKLCQRLKIPVRLLSAFQ